MHVHSFIRINAQESVLNISELSQDTDSNIIRKFLHLYRHIMLYQYTYPALCHIIQYAVIIAVECTVFVSYIEGVQGNVV